MEILISIFILSVGLLGVASLIPLGTIALRETEKSDRTGACGRAALREVKVRGMLDYRNWQSNATYPPSWWNAWTTPNDPLDGTATHPYMQPFVIDPLGVDKGVTGHLGGPSSAISRLTYQGITTAKVESIFFWNDDLVFYLPKDMSPPQNGERPVAMNQSQGNFSWFLTVAPTNTETATAVAQKRTYSVSIVVCNGRILTQAGAQPDGERVIYVTPASGGDTTTRIDSPSYGGTSVAYSGEGTRTADVVSGDLPVKNDQWVLLHSNMQCTWYRVVHAGYGPDSADPSNKMKGVSRINLVGPDWYGGTAANIVVIGGVTGVYTTTVEIDSNNLIWTR
jgi:type II secretory pathway pseudopilin PulG